MVAFRGRYNVHHFLDMSFGDDADGRTDGRTDKRTDVRPSEPYLYGALYDRSIHVRFFREQRTSRTSVEAAIIK